MRPWYGVPLCGRVTGGHFGVTEATPLTAALQPSCTCSRVPFGAETDVDSPYEVPEPRNSFSDVSLPLVHVVVACQPHRGLDVGLSAGANQRMDTTPRSVTGIV